ncbi:MAG: site-specific integrase, partial [Oscillospiraceae bacterium]|nr:site-specific integrase [Oscillospiraceae bacterium]
METIRNLSPRTIQGYWVDLRTFFRYIKLSRNLVPSDTEFEDIKVDDVDLSLVGSVTTMDIYEYLHFVMKDRDNSASARSRKISALRSYYKYLTVKAHKLDNDPAKDLEVPALKKALPKYLSLEQSIDLLNSVDGDFKERDY